MFRQREGRTQVVTDEPFRPDPADTVPPGERAELADTARHLVGERAELAETARNLVKSNTALAQTVDKLSTRIKRSEQRTYILAASLVLDVVFTVIVTAIGVQVNAASDCQAAQNDAFRDAAIQGRAAAAKERDADRRKEAAESALFAVILNSGAAQEQRRQAVVTYNTELGAITEQRALADRQRQDNPFPEGNCS